LAQNNSIRWKVPAQTVFSTTNNAAAGDSSGIDFLILACTTAAAAAATTTTTTVSIRPSHTQIQQSIKRLAYRRAFANLNTVLVLHVATPNIFAY
jgi:hypothetical protein